MNPQIMKNKTEYQRPNRAIKKLLKHYRSLCETHPDPKVARIAQGMETAIRWVIEDTRGWKMEQEPHELARCLLKDLSQI